MKVKTIELNSGPKNSMFQGIMSWTTQRQRWGITSVFIFLILWELISTLQIIDPKYISKPTSIITTGYTMITSGGFFEHFYISMAELFIGFALAVVVGLIIGILMGWNRIIGGLFDPLVMALYATPRVALVPLFVLWFGVGIGSKIFIVFIGAVFPVLINTITGIRQVDPLLLRAGRSFGASNSQLFTKILLPGALPAMMTGIRLGWGRGILGFVIGEMYVSMAGLGNLIQAAGNAMRTDQLFFLIIIVAGLGFVGTSIFQYLEHKLTPWRQEEQGR
ncbi:ABC transporter permease [Bacillus sp. Marseille-P3661]|uniref:ABC transporter permease n=1 Tax=Bacillus sp. Marseille-P3661 TaxID=1936234 RepID=UPI000C845323|nr:ABC transporter permease [Bacillus sp. Marseille-P3661]